MLRTRFLITQSKLNSSPVIHEWFPKLKVSTTRAKGYRLAYSGLFSAKPLKSPAIAGSFRGLQGTETVPATHRSFDPMCA